MVFLEYVFSNFWIWLGFVVILDIVVSAIKALIIAFLEYKSKTISAIRKTLEDYLYSDIVNNPNLTSSERLIILESLVRESKELKELSDSEIDVLVDKIK